MGHWISEPWPPQLQDRSIQWKELYPIAIACLLWGQQWSGKKLLFHCDNQAVVDIWASGTSRDPLILHLVHSIFFSAATHHYTVLALITQSLIPYLVYGSRCSAASPRQQMWNQLRFPSQNRPSGTSTSLPTVPGDRQFHPPFIPSRNS